jgi:hypothetical protein
MEILPLLALLNQEFALNLPMAEIERQMSDRAAKTT